MNYIMRHVFFFYFFLKKKKKKKKQQKTKTNKQTVANSIQEEDFVTNTYDRNLLSDISLDPINDLLRNARADLRAMSTQLPKDVREALDLRLEFRIAFLRALELVGIRKANPDSLKTPWIMMGGLLEHLRKQHSLGMPVPEAFSTKMQRRLASTMPPRPIVQLTFEDTCERFKKMAQDGQAAMDILKYSDPQSLMVNVLLPHCI
jgi:N-alpha-acetyltransferase 35, NatC auxiliary subunit